MKSARAALVLAGLWALWAPMAHASGPATARPPAGMTSASIMGSAWNRDNSPLPGARVQLRSVISGQIVGTSIADERGRFGFTNIEGGTYVVELLAPNGKVVTVGQAIVIAPGETVATFVRLGSKVPWFAGFFNNAAAAAASTAATQGITALAPVQLPISAGSGS